MSETSVYSSPAYKRSRLAYLVECAFEYFVAFLVEDAFLSRLLRSIGFDDAACGLIASVISLAFLFQLVSVFVVRRIHAPHHCLSIPSVIPMIPGVLMYRALFALIEMQGIVGEVTVAVHNSITASLIILAIAAGVAVPNIFMRSLLGPAPESRR